MKIFEYRDGILLKAVDKLLQSSYKGEIFYLNDALRKTFKTQEIVYAVNIAYKNNPKNKSFTYKFWEKTGISGKFVPYDSGTQAMAAVIGGLGQVYVGNPADISGKSDLKIIAISAQQRLAQFPDVPTLKESGIQGMDEESMWRGFTLKKGTPPEIEKWYDTLFEKITNDPEWRAYFEKDGMEVVHYRADKFNQLVNNDMVEMARYLKPKK